MSTLKLANLFLVVIILSIISEYHESFDFIETIFYYLFWIFIICLLGLAAVMPIVKSNGEDDYE